MAEDTAGLGVSTAIIEAAKVQVEAEIFGARSNAQVTIGNAQTKADQIVAGAQSQAKVIIESVAGYYFASQKAVIQWIPRSSEPPRDISPIENGSMVLDITVDENGGVLLWSTSSGRIMSSGLKSGIATVLYHSSEPQSIATDSKSGNIYWASCCNSIYQGTVEGASRHPATRFLNLNDHTSTVLNLQHLNACLLSESLPSVTLKIDAARDAADKLWLFWADGTSIYKAVNVETITRICPAEFSASPPEWNPDNLWCPTYIAVDKINSWIYWVDLKLGAICRCDFAGDHYEKMFPVPLTRGIQGLSIDGLADSVYYIGEAATSGWVFYGLHKFDIKTRKIDTVYNMNLSRTTNRGLGLHFTPTSKDLRDAIKNKAAAQLAAQNAVHEARSQANTEIQSAQSMVSDAQSQANNDIMAAQAAANKTKQAAYTNRYNADTNARSKINTAHSVAAANIAKAKVAASTMINESQSAADAKIAVAREKLNAAREKQRKQLAEN